MSYEPTSPILTLCDALVSRVEEQWKPKTPDRIERDYLAPQDEDLGNLEGRRVLFIPLNYSDEPETKTEDRRTFGISVLTYEKYRGEEGRAPKDWVDERVDFVDGLIGWLDFWRDGLLEFGDRRVWTAELEPVTVFDEAELLFNNLFWSQLDFTFSEVA